MKPFAILRTWLTWRGKDPLTQPSACVNDTGTAKGRGVYALRDFHDGEVVEACPVVSLATPYEKLPGEIQNIVFQWVWLENSPVIQAVALGYGSLYNSDNPSNMRYEIDRPARIMRFIDVRHNYANEELTVNYSGCKGAAASDTNWWFSGKSITPIFSANNE